MNDKSNNNKNNTKDENKVKFSNDQLGENSTDYVDDKTKNNCGCNQKKNK